MFSIFPCLLSKKRFFVSEFVPFIRKDGTI
jgi:hypothetical protein